MLMSLRFRCIYEIFEHFCYKHETERPFKTFGTENFQYKKFVKYGIYYVIHKWTLVCLIRNPFKFSEILNAL